MGPSSTMLSATSLLMLTLLVSGSDDEQRLKDDIHVIKANLTDFDCDFAPGESCLWTWERDNFTDLSLTVWPGQNGFYRMSGRDVAKFYHKARQMRPSQSFFGPENDRHGSREGKRLSCRRTQCPRHVANFDSLPWWCEVLLVTQPLGFKLL